ncbi:histidine N-acetyltransferase [Biomphalaria glabrata]|nr:histidine N-acetyltransferase-like [Biomphalaria glabrata]
MSPASGVFIRRARPEDYDGVMAIGCMYNGRDYLSSLYQKAVNDPDIYPLVAEVKGQVVGFYMNHILDGGLSVMKRAARVHPSFRKMGIMHELSHALDRHVATLRPGLQYLYISASDVVASKVESEYKSLGLKETHRKPFICLDYYTKDLSVCDVTDHMPSVTTLSYDDIKLLFTLEDVLDKFFDSRIVFNNFVGYRCLESNIKHFLDENKEVCVTIASSTKTPNTAASFGARDIDVVTFSEWFKTEVGLIYVVSIYTSEGSSDQSIRAHLWRHVDFLRKLNLCDKGIFEVSFGLNVSEEKVRSYLKQVGIFKHSNVPFTMEVLFERKF